MDCSCAGVGYFVWDSIVHDSLAYCFYSRTKEFIEISRSSHCNQASILATCFTRSSYVLFCIRIERPTIGSLSLIFHTLSLPPSLDWSQGLFHIICCKLFLWKYFNTYNMIWHVTFPRTELYHENVWLPFSFLPALFSAWNPTTMAKHAVEFRRISTQQDKAYHSGYKNWYPNSRPFIANIF